MITLVAARSRNGVIGINNKLPWHIPSELKYFKKLTSKATVIMGRKTFESLNSALPNRQNIVLSKDKNIQIENVQTVHSLEDAIKLSQEENIFIIGGSSIYKQALDNDLIDLLKITIVNLNINTQVTDNITYFPLIEPKQWKVVSAIDYLDDSTNIEYAVVEYNKRSLNEEYTPLVYLPASRFHDQTIKMKQILQDGLCPFCMPWLDWYHDSPIIFSTKYWIVTANDNPYSGTSLDLLIIPTTHVTSFNELSKSAQMEFGQVIARIIEENDLNFGAIGMRFGEMWHTGGSVSHLHAQLKVGDIRSTNFTPIRFKMSSLPIK